LAFLLCLPIQTNPPQRCLNINTWLLVDESRLLSTLSMNAPFSEWNCLLLISWLLDLVSGITFLFSRKWRRRTVKSLKSMKSSRRTRILLKILPSGFVMILDPVPTTCTKNIVIQLSLVLWQKCMRIWVQNTELDDDPFKLSKPQSSEPQNRNELIRSNITLMTSNSNYCTEFLDHPAKHSDRHSKQSDPQPSSKHENERERKDKRGTRERTATSIAVAGTIAGVGTGAGKQAAQTSGMRTIDCKPYRPPLSLIRHSNSSQILLISAPFHCVLIPLLSIFASLIVGSHVDLLMHFDRRGEESRAIRSGVRWDGRGGDEESQRPSSFDWLCIWLVTATVSFVHFLVFLLRVRPAFGFVTAFGHAFVEITFG